MAGLVTPVIVGQPEHRAPPWPIALNCQDAVDVIAQWRGFQ
jgi:hypothetical protein